MRLLTAASLFTLSALALCTTACGSEPPPDDTAGTQDAFETYACNPLPESWMKTKRISADNGKLQLRVGEAKPENGAVVADILYFHGFSDRMDNHKPLFDEWTKHGARVVSFEYPSHGETCGNGLKNYTFANLVELAATVERETSVDPARPLYLAGWSTGGLIATRLAQGFEELSRPIAGTILFAPGVDVHVDPLLEVTLDSLTSLANPPHTGPISPTRPGSYVMFSAGLLNQGSHARNENFPASVPTLLFTGGDTSDIYADSAGLKSWVSRERELANSNITGVACEGGKHELDNEAEPIGQQVRSIAGEFFAATVKGKAFTPAVSGPCATF